MTAPSSPGPSPAGGEERFLSRGRDFHINGDLNMGSFSIWHWLIVLVIVLLVFGTKKLRGLGSDLGGAVKGFKEGIKEASSDEQATTDSTPPPQQQAPQQVKDAQTIEGEVREKTRS